MTKPQHEDKDEHSDPDELDLEPDTVQDLEPDGVDADGIRGGACPRHSSDLT